MIGLISHEKQLIKKNWPKPIGKLNINEVSLE